MGPRDAVCERRKEERRSIGIDAVSVLDHFERKGDR